MLPLEFHSFDDGNPRRPTREQKFTQAEIDVAKQIARQEGVNEGMQVAAKQARTEAAQREQALVEVSRVVAEQCGALLHSYHEYLVQQAPVLTQLATSIARKVSRHALKNAPLKEIEGVVHEAMPLLVGQPEIIITVHSSFADSLKERVQGMLKTDAQKVAVHVAGEDAMGMQDCRIAWKDGSIARDTNKLWQQIETLLEAHVGKMPVTEAEVLALSSSNPQSHAANE